MDAVELLREFIALPGPGGQEDAVRDAVAAHVTALGRTPVVDAKGNLLLSMGSGRPRVVVTAHLDEIALMVREILPDGRLKVLPHGGIHPWKLGEGPVLVLADEPTTGVLGFGSVHTESPSAPVRQADRGPLVWEHAMITLGLPLPEVVRRGIRPGTRVVVHPSRRTLTELGPQHVAGYFLDDRADLVSWLLALDALRDFEGEVLFAATASEEVGGEGALYLLHEFRPEVCLALELGPHTPDAPVILSDQPTVWARDSFAAMTAGDGKLLASLGLELGMRLQFQALSRGGSDASCAASKGLCARPITLGLPMENSHGFEIMHRGAMARLAELTVALVKRLT